MKVPKAEDHRVRSFDGTEIAYRSWGEGDALVFCNGLGASWKSWRPQIAYFMDRYRVIAWDYRGLQGSASPADESAFAVVDHARDLLAVLEAERVDRAALVGWSLGTQVTLELFRAAPERVAALALLNGVAGQPWQSVLNLGLMSKVVPGVLRGAKSAPGIIGAVVTQLAKMPETSQVARRLGLIGGTVDDEMLQELHESFRALDMRVFLRILEQMGEHDARDILQDLDVPVLLIAGQRDPLAPPSVLEAMAAEIRGAELLTVPKGTHYALIEQPELYNLRLEKFFTERGYEATAPLAPAGD